MPADNLQDALDQVRAIHERLVDRQRFRGYSGRTRMLSGLAALATAWLLASGNLPRDPRIHLAAWGAACVLSVAMNLSALAYWFWFNPEVRRDLQRLKPVLHTIPPLLVGGALTAALVLHGQLDFLFGVWMCLYGLVNLNAQIVLPREIRAVGWFYILGGFICLLHPGVAFLNPWPMGLVFGAGEALGGVILHRDRFPDGHWLGIFGIKRKPS